MRCANSDALQSAINASVKDSIDSNPVIFGFVSYPLLWLAMVLLFIFIILVFFQCLGSLFAKGWLFILQSHVKFMQEVLSFGSKSVSNFGGVAVNSLVSQNPEHKNNSALQLRGSESNSLEFQERLANILARLEPIREEQNQLLQEASAILGNKFKAE